MAGQIAELGARRPAARVPRDGHADGARAAGRGRRPRARRVPARAVGERASGSCARSASRRCSRRPSSGSTPSRSRSRLATARAADPGAHEGLGGRRRGLAARRAARDGAGAETDRAGRIAVEPDLTLAGPPRGVRARRHGHRARTAAARRRAGGDAAGPARRALDRATGTRTPFRYHDKGELATIGRSRAVGDVKGIRVSGLHRLGAVARHPHHVPRRLPEPLLVLTRWAFSYITRGRGARVIHRLSPGAAAATTRTASS